MSVSARLVEKLPQKKGAQKTFVFCAPLFDYATFLFKLFSRAINNGRTSLLIGKKK